MLHQRDGRLTRDLLRTPGGFGLGQVPAKGKPDATIDMVCGYCSTGCSLTVHLQEGVAVGLTPAADYPVNRGVACPKGWEALTVLDAGDRATTPLRRDAAGVRRPVSWDEALRTMVERFRRFRRGTDRSRWRSSARGRCRPRRWPQLGVGPSVLERLRVERQLRVHPGPSVPAAATTCGADPKPAGYRSRLGDPLVTLSRKAHQPGRLRALAHVGVNGPRDIAVRGARRVRRDGGRRPRRANPTA